VALLTGARALTNSWRRKVFSPKRKIIADQIRVAMDEKHLNKSEMAARMKTSRRQLDRLLDPTNGSVTLATLRRAASAVGRTLRVELD
jgi:antitoxin HicB